MWQVLSLQVGRVREMSREAPAGPARRWRSATYKEACAGPVRLTRLGFGGDEQADLENHGGEEKAVLFYPAQHYTPWGRDLPEAGFGTGGGFGENLTVDFTEQDVAVGDVLRIGSAVIEISQPRVPCWKQAWRWGVEDLVERMQASGRTGFYGRVLEPGDVQAGDTVERTAQPFAEVTIARLNRAMHEDGSPAELRELASCPALAPVWRRWLAHRAGG